MFDRETHSRPVLCPRNLCAYVAAVFAMAHMGCTAEPDVPIEGTFLPVIEEESGASGAGLDVFTREGEFILHGGVVDTTLEIEWQNTAASLDEFPVRVRLPYEPVLMLGNEVLSGEVALTALDDNPAVFIWFGSDEPPPNPPTPGMLLPIMDQVSGAIMVRGTDIAPDGSPSILAHGRGRQRVRVSLSYETTGQYQYESDAQ